MTLNNAHRDTIANFLWSQQDIANCLCTCVCNSDNKDNAATWAKRALDAAGVTHVPGGPRITRTAIRAAMTRIK